MTERDSPFPVDAPDLIGVGAQSIVERAKPLGLVWTRRLATVIDATTDTANAVILFDGDTDNVTAVSMVGEVPPGTRVYVDMVPPAANFIVGIASSELNPLSPHGTLITRVQATTDSAAIGAEAVILTSSATTLRNNRAFRMGYGSRWTASTANTGVVRFRRTSAAGTEILAFSHEMVTSSQWRGAYNVAINKTGADINQVVVLTVGATAGTVVQNGAATIPRYFEIWDCGAATDFTGCPSV